MARFEQKRAFPLYGPQACTLIGPRRWPTDKPMLLRPRFYCVTNQADARRFGDLQSHGRILLARQLSAKVDPWLELSAR